VEVETAMMETTLWTAGNIVSAGEKIYESNIRQVVETPDNIGKMLTLDVETGEYRIHDRGMEIALELKQQRPMAKLYTLKIGYEVGASFGGLGEWKQK
jgi:hypothetical protein